MKRFLTVLMCFLLSLSFTTQVSAATPAPPAVSTQAAILMDAQSGQVLYERNPDERLAIASITKIMTAIVALEKGNLDEEVVVGPGVLDRKRVYGTLIFLEPGERFTLRDLLYALLMNSANDAAVAIAEHIGGSVEGFVQLMNQKAKELGAVNTNFVNPHGLSEIGHYSSARDMAIIARYGLRNPAFAEIVKTKDRMLPRNGPGNLPNKLENHNRMLWLYPGADGVKTGYTDLAGHTLVTSASRNGRQLIVVMLKGTDIRTVYKEAANLLDYGFYYTSQKLLASKGQVLESVQLEHGQMLKLSPGEDIFGTTFNNDQDGFELKVKPGNLSLPVKAGEQRGTLEIYHRGKVVQTVSLVAFEDAGLPQASKSAPKSNTLWYLLAATALVFLATLKRLLRRPKGPVYTRRQYRYHTD